MPIADPAPPDPSTPPAKPRRLRGLLINLLIVILIFVGVHWYKARPLAHGAAPDLQGALIATSQTATRLAGVFENAEVQAASGPTFDLVGLRGQTVLVHFWATWCPVCKLSEAAIDDLSAHYQVITVAMQSGSSADVEAYLRARQLRFPTIADPDGAIASAWGVPGVPASFIVGADGQIRYAGVGYTAGLGLRARLWAGQALD